MGRRYAGAKSKGNIRPLHVVSAWVHENEMVLGQIRPTTRAMKLQRYPNYWI